MKDFQGKVAVVTGAASGIGYGLAERCAREGMKVVLADIEESPLAEAERNIKGTGADVLAVKTDVSKAADVEALAKKTLETFGAVHLLFNNAGVSGGTNLLSTTLHDWEWTLGVNLWGVIYGVHYFLPIMVKQDEECRIVNTASVAGLMSGMDNGPYAVSKHGVVTLSETLYREMEQASSKVSVSVICPGIINTNIIDSERNRPAGLKNPPNPAKDLNSPQAQQVLETIKRIFANGMLPEKVAGIVFDAIKENKFYILPNAETFKDSIHARLDDVRQERNPTSVAVKFE